MIHVRPSIIADSIYRLWKFNSPCILDLLALKDNGLETTPLEGITSMTVLHLLRTENALVSFLLMMAFLCGVTVARGSQD